VKIRALRGQTSSIEYKALSGERSPGFDTILKVIHALGLKLHAEAVGSPGLKSIP